MNQTRNLIPLISLSLAILMAGSWWLGRRSAQPQTFAPTPAQSPAGNTPGTAPAAEEEKRDARTFAVVLCRGLVRGYEKGSKPLLIPPTTDQVRLEARVEVIYPRYEAVLLTAESKPIWSQRDLEAETSPGGKRILLYVSKSLLPPGDYVVTVHGLPSSGSPETVAEYSFRVGTAELGARVPGSAWSTSSRSGIPRYETLKCFGPECHLTSEIKQVAG
jgi:hypothetical protein